ncbi:MAG: hypothetical protein ACE5FT_03180 [Candidatus Nanoarchaeia archaeon]
MATVVYDLFGKELPKARFLLVHELERLHEYDPEKDMLGPELENYRTGRVWAYFDTISAANTFISNRQQEYIEDADRCLMYYHGNALIGPGNSAHRCTLVTHESELIECSVGSVPENLTRMILKPESEEIRSESHIHSLR